MLDVSFAVGLIGTILSTVNQLVYWMEGLRTMSAISIFGNNR